MKNKEYGHWSGDGREYIITERKTPRHWYNYMFNDSYVGFVSQVGAGEGFCQDDLGTRVELIADRCLYVTDKENKTWHTANGLPMSARYDAFACHHGLGYTKYVYEKDGIAGEYTIFVPEQGDFEQWIVTLTNRRKTAADLGVIAYAATNSDGHYTPQGYNSMEGHWSKEEDAVWHRISTKFKRHRNGVTYSYMMCDRPVIGYDCRKNAFIGVYGSKENPEALEEHFGCTNSDCVVEKLCFALETVCTLQPGESKTICFQIGHVMEKDEIAPMRRYLEAGVPQKLLSEVVKTRATETDGVKIKTPDEDLNLAFNSFYQYSTVMGAHWARVRHNGYRDMASDTECFGIFNPTLAWERFKKVLSFQYSSGYAPRTIKDGKIQDNNFSDCAVWLLFTAHTLVMELGDLDLLREEVPFNDGTTATVFEHLRRAVNYLYHFSGENGLIKIWGGDWNDGMNWAGLEGKGVSVWLSIAWYRANKCFMELAELMGETDLIKLHQGMGETMRQNIETYGWDGKYYITAINDDGKKIGSQESSACKMWLNPQLWAVMAGIAPKEKLLRIMEEVDSYLETPYGTLINRPAYTECDTRVGNFTRQPAGTLLNESVYLHPMTWKLMVECILKRRDALQMTLKKFLPWNHEYSETHGEPYILYNFYASEKAGYRAGIAGQSWRTASTHCFIRAMVRYIYGLVPTMEGLRLDPCLPPDWQECEIQKHFRNCQYKIVYHQADQSDGRIDRIVVNGKVQTETLLPYVENGFCNVEVFLK